MDPKEGKTAEELQAEKEYSEGWDEAEQKAPEVKKDEGTEGLPEGEAPKEQPHLEAGKEGDEQVSPPPKSKNHGEVEALEKALNDTKSYATKLASEKKELEKTLEEFKRGKATAKDVQDQRDAVTDALKTLDTAKSGVYEDYPELKPLIDPLITTLSNLERSITEITKKTEDDRATTEHQRQLNDFNSRVKPEITKVHPDYDDIMGINVSTGQIDKEKMDAYMSWAEKQRPALRFAALNSSDPQDICEALTEFKKAMATPEVKRLQDEKDKQKKDRIVSGQVIRGGKSQIPLSSKEGNKDDYDAGWDEAGKKKAATG